MQNLEFDGSHFLLDLASITQRNTMFPSSIPASRNATTPSVETSTTDAYFLSWGSSVNVSEDLRRSIRSEIEEIDASIQSLESTINSETRTSMHLHKDLSHASFEMIGLRRSMGDELDAASMNEQVKKRMGETQKTEVVHPVSMATPLKSPVLSNGDGIPPDEINNNDTTKDHHGAERVTEAGTTHIIFLSKRTAEKEALARSILKDTGLLDQKNVLALSYEQESRAIQNRIEGDDLVRVLHEAEKEVEANKRDKEIELQRKRNTKEAVQYARTKCGGYAQQIADKVHSVNLFFVIGTYPFCVGYVLTFSRFTPRCSCYFVLSCYDPDKGTHVAKKEPGHSK